ncbi:MULTISPECIES: hypothetical protein [Streptosporangium]|uniref:MarR family transcriptional regulator n=1 Tax=Streptosporangium brasiliense TaxID=47480 RepID=A0ABT9RP74_9ACTN|nr:hypothetical protein [Streptosporangium brasiliense]MDP9870145.1 hypothetical protein [Streptosporangium brasiliense]
MSRGARTGQARAGTALGSAPLTEETLAGVREVHDELLRPLVHHRW